ncbi:MAG: AMP-binding protein, partial [Tepidisphaeraceae bacterium]
MSNQSIESSMHENRVFAPAADAAAKAWINSRRQYEEMYRESIDRPEEFWGKIAGELHWFKKWDRVLEWKPPFAKWFVGGRANASYNCLDFQIERGRGNKTAILWEGENGEVRSVTYEQLRQDVCRLAGGLKKLGVKKGTRVTIYMPMIPEAAVAMLACARLGAPHSVIFGGFSSQAIADRLDDAGSELVITADGGRRRGQIIPLKSNVDEAGKKTARLKKVIVFKHTAEKVAWVDGRDIWWSDVI